MPKPDEQATIDAFVATQINVNSARYEPRPLNEREKRRFAEIEADRRSSEELMRHNFVIGEPLPESVRAACRKVHDDYMSKAGF